MDDKQFYASLGFFNERFILNVIKELEKNSLLRTAFKEDTNGSVLNLRRLWLYNKALIDQLVRSIRENIWTLVFRKNIFLHEPHNWSITKHII